jgi:8-oxo-dGTP diphosphatase
MTEYSLGFLFSKDYRTVALIKKNKPDWQKGLLNGIGGKKEVSETLLECMVREFKEETGFLFTNWEHFLDIGNDTFLVSCFKGICDNLRELESTTDEKIQVENVSLMLAVGHKDMIPNLRWILPFALDNEVDFSKINYK